MTAANPHARRAIATMLVAVLMFSMMDALLKLLSEHYPPFQVATLRGASSLPFVLTWAFASGGGRSLLRVRWPLHLLRGALGVGMMASFVYGVNRLPLSTAYSIFFIAPLLITALSGPLLSEQVGPRRWVAIGIGLLGVLVLLRPTGAGMLSVAALAILGAALGYAVTAITVRVLARTDSTQAMMVWLMGLMTLGAGALAWQDWVPLRAEHAWLIAGLGVAGSLGQYAVTEAFRLGEASLIAPLEYTALIWGVMLDLALWGVLPDAVTWVGAAIIVASGLYLLRRERVHLEAEHP
ncbi:EamA domain-containing membrane protein RarD [Lysobacter sp. yr284]|uniref:DMT family transporter n=1 Tax=Lysobacter sp. yr284 TaxID=1761791 RepID=UPI0008949898|nr:DMT family transporter [Lysobacter sp. yr284]SDY82662.1 EamA domain-containing membrane protein RarD [Lysobacter sp. yr284]